ncbi:hypothetical protein FOA52_002431 [Chlamydomonas sp. UWO 241]|nr:hypothetical protein FOA52_002431 [Chlamydomonas sp. UWO 241]
MSGTTMQRLAEDRRSYRNRPSLARASSLSAKPELLSDLQEFRNINITPGREKMPIGDSTKYALSSVSPDFKTCVRAPALGHPVFRSPSWGGVATEREVLMDNGCAVLTFDGPVRPHSSVSSDPGGGDNQSSGTASPPDEPMNDMRDAVTEQPSVDEGNGTEKVYADEGSPAGGEATAAADDGDDGMEEAGGEEVEAAAPAAAAEPVIVETEAAPEAEPAPVKEPVAEAEPEDATPAPTPAKSVAAASPAAATPAAATPAAASPAAANPAAANPAAATPAAASPPTATPAATPAADAPEAEAPGSESVRDMSARLSSRDESAAAAALTPMSRSASLKSPGSTSMRRTSVTPSNGGWEVSSSAAPPMHVTQHDRTNTINAAQLLKMGTFKLKPGTDTVAYDELMKLRLEDGIDPTRREEYLSDAEFSTVFGMGRDVYRALPQWKRTQHKKAVGLF